MKEDGLAPAVKLDGQTRRRLGTGLLLDMRVRGSRGVTWSSGNNVTLPGGRVTGGPL